MTRLCAFVHREPCCGHSASVHAVRVVDWWDDEPVGICADCDDEEMDVFNDGTKGPMTWDSIHEWVARDLEERRKAVT